MMCQQQADWMYDPVSISWAKRWCAATDHCAGITSNAPHQENQIIGETLWLKAYGSEVVCDSNWVSFCKGPCPGENCPTKEEEESALSQFYRNQWGCGDGRCLTVPKNCARRSQHLNRNVMKKANKMVELARQVHATDEKVETKMASAKSKIDKRVWQNYRKFKNQKNNLISSQQTLTG